ncbi:MAG TPA: 3-hydroxyacyl-CoA dehydrogenase NAD-binding domain-containing protein [Casimicrobiaceae bacterium]|nr:3-hydroxyacyl-CoA dehydrogenase NAD-binding domain-containing protein [Casimicrobiaceae bacterium]
MSPLDCSATGPGLLRIRHAAVLGAGVMGAQIAAHLANAGVPVLLFDLATPSDPSALARRGIDALAKLEPAPLGARDLAAQIEAASYDGELTRLSACDLVIEAIGERIDWKRDLYARIAPHVGPSAALASNTSGLSLAQLARALPAALRPRFCGVHFFNPPRYMRLTELVATADTDPDLLNALESWLTTALGKGVIRAKDTPNFIANRIGIFSVLATMHHGDALGLRYDEVDALTGTAIGRAKSATYRTADVVGLDTMAHVVKTMQDGLPDDPWHRLFATPASLAGLVAKGALGQKTRAGYYRKVGRDIEVLDPAAGAYARSGAGIAPEVAAILALQGANERYIRLRESSHRQARFLWAIHRDMFHYAAHHLAAIADNARDVDLAIRWGFGWRQGPFELWQAAGWHDVAAWIESDRAAGRTLAGLPLPAWVGGKVVAEAGGVHAQGGAYSPSRDAFVARSSLAVYRRQAFPEAMPGERQDRGTTIFQTDALRMWHLVGDVGIVSFATKMNTVSEGVLDGLQNAIERAERQFAGLVIWQAREPFSLGANLAELAPAIERGEWEDIDRVVASFQQTSLRLRYSLVPTVAAVRGMALGGGCELALHCDRTVAALESYIGLPETGVGLIPGGGGSKELALRAADEARRGNAGGQLDQLPFLRTYFQAVAKATVSKSALEARELGFLRPADVVVMHPDEVLHVALAQARALADAGYRPPFPPRAIPVAGRTGLATLEMMLVNMREGAFITSWDFEVGLRLARAMCGGDVDAGSLVDERWLLEVERREFMELLRDSRTQARIAHTLATGKPLRN